jgi:hypothetical protein
MDDVFSSVCPQSLEQLRESGSNILYRTTNRIGACAVRQMLGKETISGLLIYCSQIISF